MGATVAFTDLGSLAGAGLPNISDLADQQLYLETRNQLSVLLRRHYRQKHRSAEVLEQVAIVAPTDSTVLLHGETGTGKGLIALSYRQAQLSARARPCSHELRGDSLRTVGERTVWS